MRVGIIGTGDAAFMLGRHWHALGHEVWIGLDQPDALLTQRIGQMLPHAEISDCEDAAGADVVVLAVPGHELLQLTRSLGDLEGRVVLDCSWGPEDPGLNEMSRAEAMQMLSSNGRFVRVVPQLGWENAQAGTTFICGDEPESVQQATELLQCVADRVVPVGALQQARHLLYLGSVWLGWWNGVTAIA